MKRGQLSDSLHEVGRGRLTHILFRNVGLGTLGLIPRFVLIGNAFPLLLRSDGRLQSFLVQSDLVAFAETTLGEVLLDFGVRGTLALAGRDILKVLLC
jgi:hypothetical protein